jgi:hypothetical protein
VESFRTELHAGAVSKTGDPALRAGHPNHRVDCPQHRAGETSPAKILPSKHHCEVQEIFNALGVLIENSAEQKRLNARVTG